jgi:cobalamin-dependent methionine synthase I
VYARIVAHYFKIAKKVNMIGENIHIISPSVKEAIINRDENFILNLVEKQVANGTKTIDLTIGPAKGQLVGAMSG